MHLIYCKIIIFRCFQTNNEDKTKLKEKSKRGNSKTKKNKKKWSNQNRMESMIIVDELCTNNSVDTTKYFRRKTAQINDLDSIIYLQQPGAVDDSKFCSKDTYLLIFVLSHFKNVQNRDLARKTWASVARERKTVTMRSIILPEIRVVFVLGRAPSPEQNAIVAKEQKLHGDILQINKNETYENLVYKTLISLRYARDFCFNAKYIMKVDDDILINFPLLVDLLQKQGNSNQTEKIIGKCAKDSRVWRPNSVFPEKQRTKFANFESWILSCENYPLKYYPCYTYGHGYVITSRLAWDYYFRAKYMKIFQIEDAFVTGVLRLASQLPSSMECNDGFSSAGVPIPYNDPDCFPVRAITIQVTSENIEQQWSYLINFED